MIREKIKAQKDKIKNKTIYYFNKYWFKLERWKIIFDLKTKLRNKLFKKPIFKLIFWIKLWDFFSIPFIYWMIIPSVFLDICLFIYQQTALRLYWIPLVKRSDYIVFDRNKLDYLNNIQKFNCMYCSYINWLYWYAAEIAWRTEQYWCPIKHAKKVKWLHRWNSSFADYWDPEWFNKIFTKKDSFKLLEND